MNNKDKIGEIFKILRQCIPDPKIALNYSNPWELLVAVVLSAQSTDKKVNEITLKLFNKYKTVGDYANAPVEEFQNEIMQIGLYRNKGKNILASARMIVEKFDGNVPKTMEELLTLPGIGRKSANIILGNAYGVVEGIAVDTHVQRLSRLFGLTTQKDPNKIEQDLLKIIPQSEWLNFNHALVLYGREYCTFRCKHTDCPLRGLISV